MVDVNFQKNALYSKINYTKSSNADYVCNGIMDIKQILKVLGIDDPDVLDPLDTAYQIADVSLGFGQSVLQGCYARQVSNLIDDFERVVSSKLDKIAR